MGGFFASHAHFFCGANHCPVSDYRSWDRLYISDDPRSIRDVPTHVGMARAASTCGIRPMGCPHPRGDGPTVILMQELRLQMSPPTWGWPADAWQSRGGGFDVPTHVGMARMNASNSTETSRCPHPRGDGPRLPVATAHCRRMSPPTWGWPVTCALLVRGSNDVPTHVGMARSPCICAMARPRCPHPRGDGPDQIH